MTDESDPRPPPELESRRRLTILFTDLSDSTHLSGVMEAETYAELLDDVRRAFTASVSERGGAINQFQGDGLQALFGYPRTTEHAGRRATEAALEMHARVRDLRRKYADQGAPGLSVHSGIHSGLMLARHGDDVAGRVELFGPAPGIAKHLSDEAQGDEVLVSEETLGPSRLFFHTSERREVTLKGREGPLGIYRILSRSTLRTRFEAHAQRGLLPFIGRTAPLKRLQSALDIAATGTPRFVAISAPAGLGKTRLAEEFLQRAADAGCTVLRGWCEVELSAQPLQPFLQMLRTLFQVPPGTAAATQAVEEGLAQIDPALQMYRDDLLQALSIALDAPDRAAGGAETRRPAPEKTVLALSQLFAALARRAPLVLFVDDWHWSDGATRQVVQAIRDGAPAPILLLAATRPLEHDDAQLASTDVVDLGPFNDDEADCTIGALLPGVDPFVTGEIRRYAGGNPLFIEELCHSVASAGPRSALIAVHGGSAWLETLIESRVARLPVEQAEVLSAAGVIGNVVPAWLLAELTGCDEEHPLVRSLSGQDLVFPGERGGTLRFKHGITRDVVYGAVGLQKRRAMHRRIAQLIQDRTEPGAEAENCEALAYHHAGAAEFEPAARHAEAAGDKAMAASSIDRAKTQYTAALQMLERLPATAERYQSWRSIVRRLGLASVFDPARGDLEIFQRAVALARDHHDDAGLAYAEYWLAYVNYALGESRAAVQHCEQALQVATNLHDARLVAQVRATLGQALAAAADYPAALTLLADTARLLRDSRPGSRLAPGVAYSLACKASILGDQGRFDEAHACFDEALAALPGAGHEVEGSVLCWRSGILLWQGRWEAASRDALAAQRVAERVRSLYLLGASRGLGAYAAWQMKGGLQPLREMADAVSWLQRRDKNLFASLQHGWLAEALVVEGHPEEARRHAAQALCRTRKRDWLGAAAASRAMARLAAQHGDRRAVQRHLARAERVAALRGSAHERASNALCLAQVALSLGMCAEAVMRLDQACEAFVRLGMQGPLEQAQRVRTGL